MKQWRCTVCGYVHKGDEPPEICPVCGAAKEYFELVEDEQGRNDSKKQAPSQTSSNAASDPEWICLVCGFIHRGATAPEKCPVCNAPPDQFDGRPATPVEEAQSKKSPLAGDLTMQSLGRTIKPMSQLVAKSELLTRLHGHPIAVHIPNGLLPVTVLFTLLAVLFKSEPLGVAAKYNCIIVAVSMPVVLITGFIDWFNRYNGHLTSIFKIKIFCGLIVTALTLVLALWWTTDPKIFMTQKPALYLFLLVNIIDFVSAAVAGFYGGKLVFRD